MNDMYSPIARCEVAHATVRTDQTQEQCAHEHSCPPGQFCPLGACFSNIYAANRSEHSQSHTNWSIRSDPDFLDI